MIVSTTLVLYHNHNKNNHNKNNHNHNKNNYIQNIQNNQNIMFATGDKVYDMHKKAWGTIKYLRNDEYERVQRSQNSSHYYYYVEYDDGGFNTYVAKQDLVKILTSIGEIQQEIQQEIQYGIQCGTRIKCIWTGKIGTIVSLRNGERERRMRELNSSHYYYYIDYDDGTFDTYVSGKDLIIV